MCVCVYISLFIILYFLFYRNQKSIFLINTTDQFDQLYSSLKIMHIFKVYNTILIMLTSTAIRQSKNLLLFLKYGLLHH